jgi:hypothetical protein
MFTPFIMFDLSSVAILLLLLTLLDTATMAITSNQDYSYRVNELYALRLNHVGPTNTILNTLHQLDILRYRGRRAGRCCIRPIRTVKPSTRRTKVKISSVNVTNLTFPSI